MTFNIPSQQGGVINNVGGDQRITGGQHGTYAPSGVDVGSAVAQLRAAVAAAGLPTDVAQQAAAQVDELEQATSGDEPDRARAATVLERLTRVLVAAARRRRMDQQLPLPSPPWTDPPGRSAS